MDYSQDVEPDQPDQQYDGGRKRPSDGQSNGRGGKKMNRGPTKPVLKVLVPNFAVGKLIGKKGANINELESKHSAVIEVSPAKDFFPGTMNRSVTISAEIDQVIEFTRYMIEEVQVEDSERGPPRQQDFQLVITNAAVGFIMGKGGSTVKVIQEETGAVIDIQKPKDATSPGERLVKVTGSTEQKVKAVEQIINKVSAEPNRMSNPNTKYGSGDFNPQFPSNGEYTPKYGGGGGGGDYNKGGFNLSRTMGQQSADPYASIGDRYATTQNDAVNKYYGGNVGVGSYDTSSYYEPKSKVKTHHLIQMEIPNAMVGSIVGKQGVTINEFSRSSGARISFSGKDEFAPGTTDDRILTIKGTKSQVQNAYKMIDQKVAEVEADFRRPAPQQPAPYQQPPYQQLPSYQQPPYQQPPSFQPPLYQQPPYQHPSF